MFSAVDSKLPYLIPGPHRARPARSTKFDKIHRKLKINLS